MPQIKEIIPDKLKNEIWIKYAKYPTDLRITQCCTCENIVLIPESIRKYHNFNYDILNIYSNGKIKNISGTAEFGHIISEKNGGNISIDNLIIQCKTCNVKQSTKNINTQDINNCDSVMLDIVDDNDLIMGVKCKNCNYLLNNGNQCKNKCIFNRNRCFIHLIN